MEVGNGNRQSAIRIVAEKWWGLTLILVLAATPTRLQAQPNNLQNSASAAKSGVNSKTASPKTATPNPSAETSAESDKVSPTTPVAISDAERIASLQRSIEADQTRINDLQKDINDPKSPYAQAEAEFTKISEELDNLKKAARQAENEANKTKLKELQESIVQTEVTWQEIKRRFDLEIESRRTKQESLESLKGRLAANKEALEKLRNPEMAPPATPPATTPAADASTPATNSTPAGSPAPSAADSSTAPSAPATPGIETLTGVPVPSSATGTAKADAPVKDDVVLKAESVVEETKKEAEAAQVEVDRITQRIDSLKKNIQLERRLRDLARQKSIEAENEAQRLRQEYYKRLSSGEDANKVQSDLDEALKRQRTAQEESTSASNHLDELQSALAMVQNDQLQAMQVAEQRRQVMERAQRELESVASPYSIHRIERWISTQGLRILIVLVVGAIVLWIASAIRSRLIDLLVNRSHRGSTEERKNRARTLVNVFHNAFITFVYGFVTVVVLEAVGYSVAPLLGGAAVLGLAIAFGAQSLIKDFFTGFMILMEQQYMLNDVVKLGGVSGQVERITLRMTVLRDGEGNVHFIPHGQITTVTNMTHGWSRALFAVQISYSSDVDRATRVLMELARDLRRDPAYAALITEEPAMLGVDELGNSGILIKFHITTRPSQQWTVKRELLRRIKLRFDEEGIVIPFPQMTLHTMQETVVPKIDPVPPNPLLS